MLSRSCSVLLAVCVAVLALISLEGCPARPNRPETAPAGTVLPQAAAQPESPGRLGPGHEGRPYDIDTRQSLLTILAYRGGALAKAGHNHVIASHDLGGTFYVPQDARRASFEVHMPVALLKIDEPELRAKEGPDFPTDVPDSAKEGTRHNMLSEALLDGDRYPDIVLAGNGLESGAAAAGAAVLAEVRIILKDQAHTLRVPVTYSLGGGELVASGEVPVRQTELGLTPFSALLGALQVQDEMRVRFRIVAHEARTEAATERR
jgi:hypothetical protein